MTISNDQKFYYIENICRRCSNYSICNKDKIIITYINDRISIKCLEYNKNLI